MRLAYLGPLLLCGYPVHGATADSARTGTDVQGRTIMGRLLHTDASKTTNEIERGGSVGFTLPVARLGVADQQIVQTWAPEVHRVVMPKSGYF